MQTERTLADRYELVSHIARGGMADVYEARDTLLGRKVAVKVLHSQFSSDEAFVKRFRREAQAAANLSHPNIVSIYDWGEDGDTYFIVMELIEGRTLRDVLKSERQLLPRRASEIGAEVASALSVAHRAGLVHRDIKPGNILLAPDGTVRVTDFGIARAWDDSQELTRTGAVIGTATYFSPEQAQGMTADERSDLYSLGVVLYEMVTGAPPFTGDSPVAVAYQHVSTPVTMPSTLNPDIPADQESIIAKALSKDPVARYQTAEDMRADLLRFLRGEAPATVPAADAPTQLMAPVTPPTVPPDETYRRLAEERPPSQVPFILTAFALLVALGVGLFLIFELMNTSTTDGTALVTVPNVANMEQDEALAMLQEEGLKVRPVNQADPEIPAGSVIATDPAIGDEVEEGGYVNVLISTGVGAANVPRVVGETLTEAMRLINLNGLTVGVVHEEGSDFQPAGTVIDQSPAAGQKQPPETPIDLWVSTGPDSVLIEDLRGRPEIDATFVLESSNLIVERDEEFDEEVEEGRVARTEPEAGTVVAAGSIVKLWVSLGPEPVVVPNIVGMTPDAARVALEELNLIYRESVTTVEVEEAFNGLVAEQSIGAGTEVDPGTTVTATIGEAPPPPTTTTTLAP
jgi:serine/threonine-protein kinase